MAANDQAQRRDGRQRERGRLRHWEIRVHPVHTALDHQFQRPWPNGFYTPYGFLPGAQWPSDTRQFGTYYVRGPW